MSMDWFRWHHGTVNDPKWRVIARKSGLTVRDVLAVFAVFLERASQSEERGSIAGWDADDVGAGLDMAANEVMAIYDAMQRKVLDGDTLSGWSKRQPKRERPDDDSAERVKKHREAKKSANSDASGNGVTPCNATQRQETPRVDKSRVEKKDTAAADARDGGDAVLCQSHIVGQAVLSLMGIDVTKLEAAHWFSKLGRAATWLADGFDPDLDIYPAVNAVLERGRLTKGNPSWVPASLKYFDRAIADRRAERIRPSSCRDAAPAGRQPHPKSAAAAFDRLEADLAARKTDR